MENIRNFIDSFLDTEFQLSSARYDAAVSNEDQESMCYEKMSCYYHSVARAGVSNYLRGNNDLSEKSLVKYRKAERVQKRILFQIKKYKNPMMGDVYKRIVRDEFIWLCYTGTDQKGVKKEKPSEYNRIFVVADTNQLSIDPEAPENHTMEPVGYRIIKRLVISGGQELIHPDKGEMEQFRISDYGKLVDVLKIQAPEEALSLADYNK